MSTQPVHFEVQLSYPDTYQAKNSEGVMHDVPTRRNITLDILTTIAERAIVLALVQYPHGEVHVVQRRGKANLIIDPLVMLAVPDE